MKKFFFNIKRYFRYAVRSAKAELKSEVADSYLNWLWWVIEPVCFMLIYTFIFGVVFPNNQPYFASFVFIGLTIWEFFNRMITGSITLITNNRGLVTKVYIPKYILLLAKSFTYLFKMMISLIIAFALIIIQGVPISWYFILFIPILFVIYILSFAMGLILMHYGVLLNDLSNLVRIALRMVFYLSGVFYNIRKRIKGTVGFVLLRANPIAFLMDEIRKVMLECKFPSVEGLLVWIIVSVVLLILGVKLINKNENSYAKVI